MKRTEYIINNNNNNNNNNNKGAILILNNGLPVMKVDISISLYQFR